jgi:hypothetical protein
MCFAKVIAPVTTPPLLNHATEIRLGYLGALGLLR